MRGRKRLAAPAHAQNDLLRPGLRKMHPRADSRRHLADGSGSSGNVTEQEGGAPGPDPIAIVALAAPTLVAILMVLCIMLKARRKRRIRERQKLERDLRRQALLEARRELARKNAEAAAKASTAAPPPQAQQSTQSQADSNSQSQAASSTLQEQQPTAPTPSASAGNKAGVSFTDGTNPGASGAAGRNKEAPMEALCAALLQNSKAMDGFRAMDSDGDGAITKAEFAAALPQLGVLVDGAQVDDLFGSFDIDGDGHITYQELHTILRYEAKRLKQSSDAPGSRSSLRKSSRLPEPHALPTPFAASVALQAAPTGPALVGPAQLPEATAAAIAASTPVPVPATQPFAPGSAAVSLRSAVKVKENRRSEDHVDRASISRDRPEHPLARRRASLEAGSLSSHRRGSIDGGKTHRRLSTQGRLSPEPAGGLSDRAGPRKPSPSPELGVAATTLLEARAGIKREASRKRSILGDQAAASGAGQTSEDGQGAKQHLRDAVNKALREARTDALKASRKERKASIISERKQRRASLGTSTMSHAAAAAAAVAAVAAEAADVVRRSVRRSVRTSDRRASRVTTGADGANDTVVDEDEEAQLGGAQRQLEHTDEPTDEQHMDSCEPRDSTVFLSLASSAHQVPREHVSVADEEDLGEAALRAIALLSEANDRNSSRLSSAAYLGEAACSCSRQSCVSAGTSTGAIPGAGAGISCGSDSSLRHCHAGTPYTPDPPQLLACHRRGSETIAPCSCSSIGNGVREVLQSAPALQSSMEADPHEPMGTHAGASADASFIRSSNSAAWTAEMDHHRLTGTGGASTQSDLELHS